MNNLTRNIGLAILLTLLSGVRADAQFPSQTGLNAAMIKLFGDIKAFSAEAQVRMLDKGGAETISMPMGFAMLDGKIRAEIEMSRVKSKDMPPEAAASLKQMGMDKMVSVVRPDKKTTFVIYPSLRSYTEVPMSKEDAADLDKKYSVQTTKLGNETIDGHSCVKNKIVVTGENGEKHEALVWNATDLKNFPVQMQMNQQEASVIMRYTNLQMGKPDGKLFEAPAGYTKYPSVDKLMQEGMMKALGK